MVAVTREDFERNVGVCLEYALYHRPVHILTASGEIVALLCRHTGK